MSDVQRIRGLIKNIKDSLGSSNPSNAKEALEKGLSDRKVEAQLTEHSIQNYYEIEVVIDDSLGFVCTFHKMWFLGWRNWWEVRISQEGL